MRLCLLPPTPCPSRQRSTFLWGPVARRFPCQGPYERSPCNFIGKTKVLPTPQLADAKPDEGRVRLAGSMPR
jgi:hypothetical protein